MSAVIIVILLTTFLCWLDSKNNNNKGLVISAVIISIYGGLRFGYGSDYTSYLMVYDQLSSYSIKDDFSYIRTEIGWNLLNVLCHPIGFFGMIIITTTFETIVIYRFIGKYVDSKYHWFANICYTFNTSMMLVGFSMMRQFLAMCIVLLAVDFVIRKKWFFAIPIVAFAGLFHASAFVFIPVCFVGYLGEKKISESWMFFLSFVIILFYFLGGPVLKLLLPDMLTLDAFEDYGESYVKYGGEGVSMFSIARIYGALLFIFLMTQFGKFSLNERCISLIYSVGVLLGSLVSVNTMAGRINMYFSVVGIAALPFIIKYLKDASVKVVFVSVYIIFLMYRFVVFFNTPIWESFLHYHTIFEQPWQ